MAPNAHHQDQQTTAGSAKQHPVAHHELHHADGRVFDGKAPAATVGGVGDATTRYDVEHLATFSTTAPSHETQASDGEGELVTNLNKLNNRQPLRQQQQQQLLQAQRPQQQVSASEPRVALQRLFELERLSGIWTQRMQIQFEDDSMLIIDCETNSIVERFHRERVLQPEAFNQYDGIYNNIIVFIINQRAAASTTITPPHHHDYKEGQVGDNSRNCADFTDCVSKPTSVGGGELHIFQCVSHRAKQLVADILSWKSGRPIHIDEPQNHHHHHHHQQQQQQQQQQPQESKQRSSSEEQLQEAPPAQEASAYDSDKMIVNKTATPSATPIVTNPLAGSETTTKTEAATKQAVQSAGDRAGRSTNNSTDGEENDVRKLSTTATTSLANDSSTSTSDTAKPLVVTVASSSVPSENVPIVNVNVKETVQVFNQIAALREKGSGGNNQTPSSGVPPVTSVSARPLSSEVSVASSGQADGVSRVSALGGQFYKQPSIRATLAPKTLTSEEQKQQASSSVDSSTVSSGADGRATSSSLLAGSSSSSRPEPPNGRTSKAPPPPPPAPSHKSHHQLPAYGVKSGDGRHMSGSACTQSSSCSSSSSGQQSAAKEASNSKVPSSARLSNGHNELALNHRHQKLSPGSPASQHLDQVTTNESYVSVLNHCFDDIEKFIIRLQQAYAATHELQAKRRHSKKSAAGQQQQHQLALTSASHHHHHKSHLANGGAPRQQSAPAPSVSELPLLSARTRGPNADDFFEILSKFKLAFNLLAKLKGCIHEPNAPELVHFLFTPLAIIIESARNVSPAVDPALVGIPYLNKDALELLSNCCTSKESDLWISLGPNWTQTIEPTLLKASRLPSSFQPIFSDGWAPVISELELIGLVAAPAAASERDEPLGGLYRSSRAICSPADPDLFEPSLVSASAGHKASEPTSIKSSSTNSTRQPMVNGKSAQSHKKRVSPISGVPQDVYSSSREAHKSRYGPGHLQEVALTEPSAYRVASMPANQRLSCQPAPKSSRRHPVDVYAAGHFSPSEVAAYLDDRTPYYPSSYPRDPSDDYTELQNDHLGPTVPSARRRQTSRVGDHRFSYEASGQDAHLIQPYADRLAFLPGEEPRLPDAYLHQEQQFYDEAEREAMLLDLGPAQADWFYELSARGALVVRVLFTRDANNDKELSVKRGELLEILDDSRKWWKARNMNLQVAHVPHTIVAVMEHYQTLDELLTNSPAELLVGSRGDQPSARPIMSSQHRSKAFRNPQSVCPTDSNGYEFRDQRHNSKTSRGAFRYF